ncbi:hypothetical protein A9G45_01260 [Gilliamella sp. HK2]|jgi:hypothetical protein|nr:hypothetical protein A9G46_03890 [Gilliamella apicola]OCG31467.1 hypothetical protein A9G45_01260 [Gilliamella apicola]
MKRIVGIRKAIYFRLNRSKYYILDGYDLVLLTVVLIELQNPKLQHGRKDDFLSIVKKYIDHYQFMPIILLINILKLFFFGRK